RPNNLITQRDNPLRGKPHYRRARPQGPVYGPWLPRTPPPGTLSEAERTAVMLLAPAIERSRRKTYKSVLSTTPMGPC
ncbi:hypothetical protein, partial [Saccharopolyspora shandongensis]|uniref:hypothetical protein n=1 Tax=Saccharopolyspora shandongensis TaxID=418495 RepID=UPI0033FF84CC